MKQFAFGAHKSKKDKRTIKHKNLTQITTPLIKGGVDYLPAQIENQRGIGICTAISLVQNQEKTNLKKYSADFQYLLQKKFYDGNWDEGSTILNALKVGMKYGFLPANQWIHTTDSDRDLPYAQYVAKLQELSDYEINRLLTLCVDKLYGYAQVDENDPQAIAKAINDSNSGVLCRYEVGKEWYTSTLNIPSWNPSDINPLRHPQQIIAGHAITMSKYDYTLDNNQVLSNTWSIYWNKQGCADINWSNYRPTEVWIITKTPIITKFNNDLWFGTSNNDVKNLQNALKILGFFTYNSTGYFGILTYLSVKAFQKANKIYNTGYCGILTRTCLNKLFNL